MNYKELIAGFLLGMLASDARSWAKSLIPVVTRWSMPRVYPDDAGRQRRWSTFLQGTDAHVSALLIAVPFLLRALVTVALQKLTRSVRARATVDLILPVWGLLAMAGVLATGGPLGAVFVVMSVLHGAVLGVGVRRVRRNAFHTILSVVLAFGGLVLLVVVGIGVGRHMADVMALQGAPLLAGFLFLVMIYATYATAALGTALSVTTWYGRRRRPVLPDDSTRTAPSSGPAGRPAHPDQPH